MMARRSLTMSAAIVIAGALLTLVGDVSAATIYGTIYRNNQPLRNIELRFDCWRGTPIRTDDRGTYRLTTNHMGQCNLVINDASGVVIFYPDPTLYDFDIDGRQLRRR